MCPWPNVHPSRTLDLVRDFVVFLTVLWDLFQCVIQRSLSWSQFLKVFALSWPQCRIFLVMTWSLIVGCWPQQNKIPFHVSHWAQYEKYAFNKKTFSFNSKRRQRLMLFLGQISICKVRICPGHRWLRFFCETIYSFGHNSKQQKYFCSWLVGFTGDHFWDAIHSNYYRHAQC